MSKPPPKIEHTKAVEWLAKATSEAGRHVNALTVTFVGVLTYVWVTLASIKHVDLLVGRMVELPLLSAEIPLKPFFLFMPLFVLVLHVYLLVQLLYLERRVQFYRDLEARRPLRRPDDDVADEAANGGDAVHEVDRSHYYFPFLALDLFFGRKFRRQAKDKLVPALIFVAYLFVFAVLPILTLGFIQNRFLPYRDPLITWIHGGVIVLDLIAAALLIPTRVYESRSLPGLSVTPPLRLGLLITAVILQFIVLIYVPTCNTTLKWPLSAALNRGLTIPAWQLQARANGPLDLQRRNLQCAELAEADLRGASLQGADLRGAVLRNADLRGAKLLPEGMLERDWLSRIEPVSDREVDTWWTRTDRARTDLSGADLWNAKVSGALLPFARLDGVRAQGADFSFADLTAITAPGARFEGSTFPGAVLTHAQLRQATLGGADLTGADLRNVRAAGADFRDAFLDAVDLEESRLYFADLAFAKLRFAVLSRSSVWGADFRRADLTGARRVVLNGAWFTRATLRHGTLDLSPDRIPRWTDLRLADLRPLDQLEAAELRSKIEDLAECRAPSAVETTDPDEPAADPTSCEAKKRWSERLRSRIRSVLSSSPSEVLSPRHPALDKRFLLTDAEPESKGSLREFEQGLARQLIHAVILRDDRLLEDLLCRQARGAAAFRDPYFEEALRTALEADASLPENLRRCAQTRSHPLSRCVAPTARPR